MTKNALLGSFPTRDTLLAEAKGLRARMKAFLGEREARALWAEAGKNRRGRIAGVKFVNYDGLLQMYDRASALESLAALTPTQRAGRIADIIHASWPLEFGASAAAISKSIMRGLQERKKLADRLQAIQRLAPNALSLGFGGWMRAADDEEPRHTPPTGILARALLGETDRK